MINKIGFENYRSFKNYTELNIKPITILVGPNSAGKSSILSVLKLLSQSILFPLSGGSLNLKGPIIKFNKLDSLTHFNNNKNLKFELQSELLRNIGGVTYFPNGTNKVKIEINNNKIKITQSRQYTEYGTIIDIDGELDSKDMREEIEEQEYFVIEMGKIKIDIEERIIKKINSFLNRPKLKEKLNIYVKLLNKHYPKYFNKIDSFESLIKFMMIEKKTYISNFYSNGLFFIDDAAWYNQLDFKVDEDNYFSCDPIFINSESFGAKKYADILNELSSPISQEEEYQNKIKNTFNLLMNKVMKTGDITKKKAYLLILSQCFFNIIDSYEIRIWKKCLDFFNANLYNYQLKDIFENQNILPPLRNFPKEFYSIEELTQYLSPKSSKLLDVEKIKDIVKTINELLKRLKINYKLSIKNISQERYNKVYIIELINKTTKYKSTLNDVGFGFSQLFPVLCSLSITNNNLTIIEQPELHLHPKMQYQLSFAFERLSKEHNWHAHGRYIMETHSEHFLRGFQVMISKKLINPEHIVIYYVSKDEMGVSSLKEMKLDDKGLFVDKWPTGFFDQGYKSSLELLG